MNKPAWKAFLVAATICLAGLTSIVAGPTTNNAPVLRVGVAPVTPPMIYKEGTKVVGVEADFAQALGREIGRPVTFVELPWEDLIDSLVADKIDIIMSSMSITRARQFRVTFSDPYLRIGQMALVRGSEQYRYGLLADSLAEKKVGVRKATTADLLVQQEFPRAKRKYFDTDEEGAIALKKGKIDLFMDDSTMVWYLAGVHEADGLGVAPLVFSEEYLGWAMKKSDTALQESVGAFFKKNQASGELNKILHRWIPKLQ